MNATIALITLLAAGPSAEVEWRIPLPPEAAQPRVVGNAKSCAFYDPKSGAVMWNSQQRIFRFDPRTRKVVPMGAGSFDEPQIDCGLGLATVHRHNSTTKTSTGDTYDVATGKHLSTVTGWPKRVGRLVMTRDEKLQCKTFTDAVTGEVMWQESLRSEATETLRAPVGEPIWATPKRWLFIIGEEGRHPNDKKGVVDVAIRTLQELKRVHLSDYAMKFDGIVGNPETGAFAVFEASNRSRICTGVFRSDLTRVPGKFFYVTDISKHGILSLDGKSDDYGNSNFTGMICADPQTGKVKWRSASKSPGKWVGGNVLVFDRLLDGKTGKSLGKLKLPELLGLSQDGKFVGVDGRTLVGGRIRT